MAVGDRVWPGATQRFIHAQCLQPARSSRRRRRPYFNGTPVSFTFFSHFKAAMLSPQLNYITAGVEINLTGTIIVGLV